MWFKRPGSIYFEDKIVQLTIDNVQLNENNNWTKKKYHKDRYTIVKYFLCGFSSKETL